MVTLLRILSISAKNWHIFSASPATNSKAEVLISSQVLQTGGKPSTWFPPGGLVEQSTEEKQNNKDEDEDEDEDEEDEYEDEDGDEDQDGDEDRDEDQDGDGRR